MADAAVDLTGDGIDYDEELALALALAEQDELEREAKEQPEAEPPSSAALLPLGTDEVFPDLHGLFLRYNQEFFSGLLLACEVRWSTKMTLCAGLCVYQNASGYCSIRLSEPLLKYRSVKEYKETLLHEMIHAYLFVTANNRDHNAHGPSFHEHMYRINALTGFNISVYHNFRDEVNHYRKHVWRCNGPCRHKPPFYGWVKRAMNRPPQKADRWWAQHQATCGGTFEKVSEPEKPPKKATAGGNGKKKPIAGLQEIDKYLKKVQERKSQGQDQGQPPSSPSPDQPPPDAPKKRKAPPPAAPKPADVDSDDIQIVLPSPSKKGGPNAVGNKDRGGRQGTLDAFVKRSKREEDKPPPAAAAPAGAAAVVDLTDDSESPARGGEGGSGVGWKDESGAGEGGGGEEGCCPVCGEKVPSDQLKPHIQCCIRDPARRKREDLAPAE